MELDIKLQILNSLRAAKTIILSRHIRPDGDAVGSSLGLAEILRASFPEKSVFVDNEDRYESLAYLGDEGEHPTDADYREATVVVVDSGTQERISNKRYSTGRELIKIDHHVNVEPYGDLCWVEDWRSSVCEMIADFALSFPKELVLNQKAATLLYAGMVTDSGRFRYSCTSPATLRLAAAMLEKGVDTQFLFANMYLEAPEILQYHADMTKRIRFTENGVAWIRVSRALRRRRHLSMEDAGEVNDLMDAIRGSLIWLVFIECDDGSVRVRLRSRFAEVRAIAERHHGGGHACACGATVYSPEEEAQLLAEADEALGAFKRSHPECF